MRKGGRGGGSGGDDGTSRLKSQKLFVNENILWNQSLFVYLEYFKRRKRQKEGHKLSVVKYLLNFNKLTNPH